MSSLFEMKKVMDPHSHMPEDIKNHFLEAFQDYVTGNNSYINYSVGEYVTSLKEGDEDSPYYSSSKAIFDKWMLENFELYEKIMILYWW